MCCCFGNSRCACEWIEVTAVFPAGMGGVGKGAAATNGSIAAGGGAAAAGLCCQCFMFCDFTTTFVFYTLDAVPYSAVCVKGGGGMMGGVGVYDRWWCVMVCGGVW